MRVTKPGGVVFLPVGKDVPPSLDLLNEKLREHGYEGMAFPKPDSKHDFGWDLARNSDFFDKVVIAVFHPNDIPQFISSNSLRWYGRKLALSPYRGPLIEKFLLLARAHANEQMMGGVVGMIQLIAGGATVFLFSAGSIGEETLGAITEELAKVDIVKDREFFVFQNTSGGEMLTGFDWDRFLSGWPEFPLAECRRFESELPEALLAFDILLQGYIAVRSEEAAWHKLRVELGLAPGSNSLGNAYIDTATANLFGDINAANKPYWFDSFGDERTGTSFLFSHALDLHLERSPAAELPGPAKERFERRLLSERSLEAAEALAAALAASPTEAEAINALADHDGGALRLTYELVRKQGRAFGWTAVASSPLTEKKYCSILLALFIKAHQELLDCYGVIKGNVPSPWSVGDKQ